MHTEYITGAQNLQGPITLHDVSLTGRVRPWRQHRLEAELLAVGLPRNMDGTEGESAQNAREIGALLEESTGLPVEFVDERGTTITAHGYLNDTNTRGKKRKAVVDAVAATVILENFLEKRRMENRG